MRRRLAAAVLSLLLPLLAHAAENPGATATNTAPASAPAAKVELTNSDDALRAYLQLQEQLHATQLAIEQSRQETDTAAAHNLEALLAKIQAIEQALGTQRARELEAMQSSNRVMLIVAGSFAGVGFLAMLLMAVFQWRAVHRLAEISAALPASHPFSSGPATPLLGSGDGASAPGQADSPNLRLLGAIDRLERRILELEHTTQPVLNTGSSSNADSTVTQVSANGGDPSSPNGEANANGMTENSEATKTSSLLGKGQSLLDLNKAEEALDCFDKVLAQEPDNSEALVKKGSALEKLQRLDEAIACYDRAIAADNSMTIAYLYKGGLFNRMERFSEALECYEQALRTQEKKQS